MNMLELRRSKLTKPSLFYATDRRPSLGMTLHPIRKMIASLVDDRVAILHACVNMEYIPCRSLNISSRRRHPVSAWSLT
jgi:hypothetical protein